MSEALNRCSLCGAVLPPSKACHEMRDELFGYTLTLGRGEFIHQHAVDAYAAQHRSSDTKPINQAAALIGLFLFVERGYNGRQVQLAHMKLGNKMKTWPLFEPPGERAALTVMDVLQAPAGAERDESVKHWARAVWEMWEVRHAEVEQWLRKEYGSFQTGV